jgi:integrase
MSTLLPLGTEIAPEVPQLSAACLDQLPKPKTFGALLDLLTGKPHYRHLCSAANRFAEYLRKPGLARDISLDDVVERLRGFRPFLENRLYAESSIHDYRQWIGELLELAQRAGWVPDVAMSPQWHFLMAATPNPRLAEVIRHFSKQTDFPGEVTLEAVNKWVDELVIRRESSFSSAIARAWDFQRQLIKNGYSAVNPIRALRLDFYGIPLKEIPEPLKSEIEDLIAFRKAAPDEDGEDDDDLEGLAEDDSEDDEDEDDSRPRRKQIRGITAQKLESMICRLYGYLVNIKHRQDITSLRLLFHRRCLRSFRKWLRKRRKVSPDGLRAMFTTIFAAIRQYHLFPTDFGKWFKRFLDSIPQTTEAERREKKAKKYLDYRTLEAIPDKIRSEKINQSKRKCGSGSTGILMRTRLAREVADLAMRELLMRWILVLPWRQRNLRECRVSGPNPNLFKGPIPAHKEVDRPDWVKKEEAKNPKAEFWQYSFSSKETKTGKPIHCVLPFSLIRPLEDYLRDDRSILIGDKTTETLFVNDAGRGMKPETIADLIRELALRYGGKRLTPHIFRDIFAFEYLKTRPLDFVTLSIQLWHGSVNTTMKYYAGRFNASCGTAAVESWLEQRRAK